MGKKKLNTSSMLLIPMVLSYLLIALFSLSLGRYSVSPGTILKILASKILPIERIWSVQAESAILAIRLPRIICASLVGGGLALSGLVMQTVFRNPMVSPDVLGTSNAAGFGAALAMVMHLPSALVSPISFLFGILSVFLVYLIASRVPNNHILGLVLGGIMVSSIFSSLLSFAKLIADPNDTLPSITYFLMGSLSGCTIDDALKVAFPFSWRISLLSLNEDEAKSLGINTRLLRAVVLILSVIIIASSVSISGVIGWIGLVVPHITRMIMGCNTRKTIPASIILGAAFLTLADTISRTIAFSEIPIGILTSLVGAPFFLYLIIREGRRRYA